MFDQNTGLKKIIKEKQTEINRISQVFKEKTEKRISRQGLEMTRVSSPQPAYFQTQQQEEPENIVVNILYQESKFKRNSRDQMQKEKIYHRQNISPKKMALDPLRMFKAQQQAKLQRTQSFKQRKQDVGPKQAFNDAVSSSGDAVKDRLITDTNQEEDDIDELNHCQTQVCLNSNLRQLTKPNKKLLGIQRLCSPKTKEKAGYNIPPRPFDIINRAILKESEGKNMKQDTKNSGERKFLPNEY